MGEKKKVCDVQEGDRNSCPTEGDCRAGGLVQLVRSLPCRQGLCSLPRTHRRKASTVVHLYSETSLVGTREDAWCSQAGVCTSETQAKMLSQQNKIK